MTSPAEFHVCILPDTQRQVPRRLASKLSIQLDRLKVDGGTRKAGGSDSISHNRDRRKVGLETY